MMSGVRYPFASSIKLTAIIISFLARHYAARFATESQSRLRSHNELVPCSYSENLERLHSELPRGRQSLCQLERTHGGHRLGFELAVDLPRIAPRLTQL